jgi:hypothetical protein
VKEWFPLEIQHPDVVEPGAYVVGTVVRYLLRPSEALAKLLQEKVVKVGRGGGDGSCESHIIL